MSGCLSTPRSVSDAGARWARKGAARRGPRRGTRLAGRAPRPLSRTVPHRRGAADRCGVPVLIPPAARPPLRPEQGHPPLRADVRRAGHRQPPPRTAPLLRNRAVSPLASTCARSRAASAMAAAARRRCGSTRRGSASPIGGRRRCSAAVCAGPAGQAERRRTAGLRPTPRPFLRWRGGLHRRPVARRDATPTPGPPGRSARLAAPAPARPCCARPTDGGDDIDPARSTSRMAVPRTYRDQGFHLAL